MSEIRRIVFGDPPLAKGTRGFRYAPRKRRVAHLVESFASGAVSLYALCGRGPLTTNSNVPWGRPTCRVCWHRLEVA